MSEVTGPPATAADPPAAELPAPDRPAADLPVGHVVVCGLDHLGVRTAAELRLRDETVVIIAGAAETDVDPARLDGIRVVRGNQRYERVLREAGVPTAAAIVLTADDDLGNLHAALAASELNPSIRIVMRLFDAELGERIPTLFPNAVALSSSALAAPGFVSAALDGESGGSFELGGRVFSIRVTPAAGAQPAPGSRQPQSAGPGSGHRDVIPIARLRPDRTVDLLPDASADEPGIIAVDAAEGSGTADRTPSAAAEPGMPGGRSARPGSPAPSRPRHSRLPNLGLGVRDRLSAPDRRLINLAAIIVILAAISALFFQVVAGFGPIDALSYAFALLTGAGNGLSDVDPVHAPLALKVYAIVLSLCGAAIVGVVYALITDAIIGSRLMRTLGRRPIPTSIRDHVIVCGLGAVGYRIALAVAARGIRVVAVELKDNGRFVAPARSVGIPVLTGDASQPEVLADLGVRTARAVIAATSNDLVNLEAALNARAVRPDMRVVVRVFDPDFALRVQHGFSIRYTRSVSHLVAPAFAAAAIGSEVVATVPVGDRRVILFARVRVAAQSPLDGAAIGPLDEVGARRVLGVIGADDGRPEWHPGPDRPLRAGEDVMVAATRAGLASLLHLSRAGSSPA